MVAIKDMEMPKNCYECIVKNHCGVGIADGWRTDRRADDCPLAEIEERKVGKWIVNKDTICCPFCNTRQKIGTAEVELLDTIFTGFKFCKYCGAEMRGAEND